VFDWILIVEDYSYLHHIILALYLGSYFGFFGLTFNFISRRLGILPALFAAPFVWITAEYIRSNFTFLALPWALLAHSQYQYPVVIQSVSVLGTYGISLQIVAVNSALAAITMVFLYRSERQESASFKPRLKAGAMAFGITAALFVALSLLYGHFIVSKPMTGKRIKVAVVQGNIEQKKKWDPNYARGIMQIYSDLTQKASGDQPAIIVWPETATPGVIDLNTRLYSEVRDIAKRAGAYLLLGSTQYQKFGRAGVMKMKYFNSAFLIRSDTEIAKIQRYDKIRLLPFGEYLPIKESIPWSYINVPNIGEHAPGKKFTVFELPDSRFGVTICWENIFPELFRRFVYNGAQFMVNITDEAWFGRTAAPYQFVSMSIFRAVENRIYVVRCGNTGVSCIIDPYGRIVDRVGDAAGTDIFVRGVMSGWVIPLESKTFYTRYGDLLVGVAFFVSAIFLVIIFLHKRQ
jgi:apolipoprotein N-acyltransferase